MKKFALLLPSTCSAMFGGAGDYTPPAPSCKKFSCPAGQKAAGNSDHQLWSYGCKDSGMNILSMADLNGGLGGLNKPKGKNVDKCCIERDICKQTCGTTAAECHNNFHACTKKVCKGDQNCNLAAMMADIGADPPEEEEEKKSKDPPEEYNYEKDKQRRDCRGYERAQNSSCICVPQDDWQLTTNANLKSFYSRYNPEKLDDAGEIKDIDDVWKKWKGKEPAMFQAMATKYKDKAVTRKVKPTPPPYKPPPPLSKEEQEKEDKRMAEQREKWKREDEARAAEREEREQKKREEREEEERQKQEELDGETVEL